MSKKDYTELPYMGGACVVNYDEISALTDLTFRQIREMVINGRIVYISYDGLYIALIEISKVSDSDGLWHVTFGSYSFICDDIDSYLTVDIS